MTIVLPTPNVENSRTLAECIDKRRSIREYAKDHISIQDLSGLLWAAQGITGSKGERATPSADGLHPTSIHVIARRVTDLEDGIYAYIGEGHSLRLLSEDIPETTVRDAGIGDQPWLSNAAVIIGIVADIGNAVEHFAKQQPLGQRGTRYVYMEAGAMAQNTLLRATDLGLAGVLVAGFEDSLAKEVLMLPVHMEPVALLCIGSRIEAR